MKGGIESATLWFFVSLFALALFFTFPDSRIASDMSGSAIQIFSLAFLGFSLMCAGLFAYALTQG